MGGKRTLAAIAAATAAFCIAVTAIFITRLVPDGSYEVAGERGGAAASSTPVPEDMKVNINTASKAELSRLSGIGESLAEAIIESRETEGPFGSPEDIMRVKGIGEGKYAFIREYITTDG